MNMKNRTESPLHKGWWAMALSALLSVMAGCGGGGNNAPPPVVNLDPTGYYGNTGTLPALGVTDMQAMIYNNRLIMVSKARGYYYDGPITVSGNTITSGPNGPGRTDSIVQLSLPGNTTDTATLNATINPADRSISGTVVHTRDSLSNPFTLQYATGRSDSTVADIVNTAPANPAWSGTLYNLTADTLTFNLADNLAGSAAMSTITPLATTNTNFQNCVFTGTLRPISGTSLYEASVTASSCSTPNRSGGPYTGFAALRTQVNPNDTLVMAISFNDGGFYYGLFGEFQ